MKSFLPQEKPASLSSSFMNSVIPLMSLPPPGAVPTFSHAASSSSETGNNMKVPRALYQLTERLRGRSNGCAARTWVHQAANNHNFWCQLYGSVKKNVMELWTAYLCNSLSIWLQKCCSPSRLIYSSEERLF